MLNVYQVLFSHVCTCMCVSVCLTLFTLFYDCRRLTQTSHFLLRSVTWTSIIRIDFNTVWRSIYFFNSYTIYYFFCKSRTTTPDIFVFWTSLFPWYWNKLLVLSYFESKQGWRWNRLFYLESLCVFMVKFKILHDYDYHLQICNW